MAKSAKPEPRVYSYIRFSTPEQSLGDSERRQVDKAKAFAASLKPPMPFDEVLTMADRGLSGYHGTHRKKGALGNFLALVEAGRIAPGSILVVEHIDRLSREGVAQTLRNIIFKLFDRGIHLQTLDPAERYEPGCEEKPKFLALMIAVAQARESSERKSKLSIDNWVQNQELARTEGRRLTTMLPHWLTVNANGQVLIRPGAAKTIKQLFQLKLKGWSADRIARKLNGDAAAWKPPGKDGSQSAGWRASYIAKILTNQAVLGVYQPMQWLNDKAKRVPRGEPIADYFPAVLKSDEDRRMFVTLQARFKKNRGTGGPQGKVANLFTNLVKCAYCGEPMHCAPKGRYKYLICVNRMTNRGCKAVTFSYDEVEPLILMNCSRLKPELVLPNPSEQAQQCEMYQSQLEALDAEAADATERQANLMAQLERTKSETMQTRYEQAILALDEQLAQNANKRTKVAADLSKASATLASFRTSQKGIADLMYQLNNVEARLSLREHLRQIILRIDVFTLGRYSEDAAYGPDFKLENLAERQLEVAKSKSGRTSPARRRSVELALDGESFTASLVHELCEAGVPRKHPARSNEFLKFVDATRMSRAGRFVRVWFFSGAWIDLVPAGSIASGSRLVASDDEPGKREREAVHPALDDLMTRYEKDRVNARKRKRYKKI